jgi:hypothetical protein
MGGLLIVGLQVAASTKAQREVGEAIRKTWRTIVRQAYFPVPFRTTTYSTKLRAVPVVTSIAEGFAGIAHQDLLIDFVPRSIERIGPRRTKNIGNVQ